MPTHVRERFLNVCAEFIYLCLVLGAQEYGRQ